MNIHTPIPTFVPNLVIRTDRKESILREFDGRSEFALTIVKAREHKFGAFGLWQTILHILQDLVKPEDDFIILCEDDHYFTADYTKSDLLNAITVAAQKGADILLGGVSGFSSIIHITENLYWVENFSGLQFTVIFRKFFNTIINAPLDNYYAADYRISDLTNDKILIYPYLSSQKEFGYSDATPRNGEPGRVTEFFNNAANRVKIIDEVNEFYKQLPKSTPYSGTCDITIPTYIISQKGTQSRLVNTAKAFSDKDEFELIIVDDPVSDPISALKQSIRIAIENDDDIIIVCNEDHEFSDGYSKEYLIRNVIEAHEQGAGYLVGGTGSFGAVIPVSENRYWVNNVLSWQFIVIYKSIFQRIMDAPSDQHTIPDTFLSEITSNKMLLYPFVSAQKTPEAAPGYRLPPSNERLACIREAYEKYINGIS